MFFAIVSKSEREGDIYLYPKSLKNDIFIKKDEKKIKGGNFIGSNRVF